MINTITALGTLVKDDDNRKRRMDEEHTTLVDQPTGRYLGFAAPKNGSGTSVVKFLCCIISKFIHDMWGVD